MNITDPQESVMRAVALALALASCVRLPLDHPRGHHLDVPLARNGTYSIVSLDGSQHGAAWRVDAHHLVTAAALCSQSTFLLAPKHAVQVVASDAELCLLRSHDDLGDPLVLSRYGISIANRPHLQAVSGDLSTTFVRAIGGKWTAEPSADLGAPVVAQWDHHSGVVGVVIPGRRISHHMRQFLRQHGIDWALEADASDDDVFGCDLGCGN